MVAATVQAQDFSFDEMVYAPEATTFKLFAPTTAKVYVEYDATNDTEAMAKPKKVRMRLGKDGIWTATVRKNLNHHLTIKAAVIHHKNRKLLYLGAGLQIYALWQNCSDVSQ